MRRLAFMVAIATLFCLATSSFAASGSINASPATVVIPSGSSVGTTTIQWSASGATTFHVTVQCNGGSESLFASSGAGTYSQNAPWIQVGSSCTFRLRQSTTTGIVLASVLVTGVGPSGSISASPQTVVIPAGSSVGTSTLQWTGSGASLFHVTVQCGGSESLFASSGPGTASQAAPWITVGSSCIFRLRAETPSGTELAQVTVVGVAGAAATGSINASPTTVVIPPGQSSGSTLLSWTSSGASQVYVLVACNGGAQSTLTSGGAGAGSYTTWISVGSSCIYQLRASSVGGTLLGSVTVTGQQGQSGSGTLTATPPHVPVKKQATYGTAYLKWTSSLSSVELRRVDSTGSETSLGSFAGNGSTSVSTIEAGRSYSFRLYGGGQLLATSATLQGVRLLTTERGGSNHLYFHNPPPVGGATYNGENYNYGIMLHYHEAGVRTLVQSQLKEMFDNGQRSMRVLVHFLHSPGQTITTTPAESSRKCLLEYAKWCPPESEYFLPLQYQQNLRDYLADIRAAGFERLLVGLGPQWINDFFTCNDPGVPASLRSQLYAGSPLVNELFEEAWGVTKEVRAITAQSGLPYLIDLGNEYVPPSNLATHGQCVKDIIEGTPQFTGYLRFLWGRYVQAYGAQDSVAFSVIVGNSWDADNRMARMPQFFSPMPPVISLHSYSGQGDLGQAFNRARVVSDNMGRRPWVIGETNNRSTVTSAALATFLQNNPQQEIRYVLQWPGFNCTTEQQCLPLDFTAFSALGL